MGLQALSEMPLHRHEPTAALAAGAHLSRTQGRRQAVKGRITAADEMKGKLPTLDMTVTPYADQGSLLAMKATIDHSKARANQAN